MRTSVTVKVARLALSAQNQSDAAHRSSVGAAPHRPAIAAGLLPDRFFACSLFKSRALIVQRAGDFFDLITFDNVTGF